MSEGQDLFANPVSIGGHAVEVDADEIGLHQREYGPETINVIVTVMEVIYNPGLLEAVTLAKLTTNRDHVFRLSGPTAVIIERHR